MILDEAIKHEEEIVEEEQYEYQECVAVHNMEGAKNCRKYAEEHRQLAEWLKDYKRLLEQESKTGHWIDVTNGRGGHKCDNCHEYAPSYQSGDEYLTKYCPNCGAKMTESEE